MEKSVAPVNEKTKKFLNYNWEDVSSTKKANDEASPQQEAVPISGHKSSVEEPFANKGEALISKDEVKTSEFVIPPGLKKLETLKWEDADQDEGNSPDQKGVRTRGRRKKEEK